MTAGIIEFDKKVKRSEDINQHTVLSRASGPLVRRNSAAVSPAHTTSVCPPAATRVPFLAGSYTQVNTYSSSIPTGCEPRITRNTYFYPFSSVASHNG